MTVLVGVMFAGFFGVVDRMDEMTLRDVRVMAGFVVISGFMVVGGRSMMTSSVIVVLRGLAVVLGAFFGHLEKPPMQYRLRHFRFDYARVNVG